MKEANFYPGPSRVFANIPEYIYEAYMEGIMSINHRSAEFMHLMEETIRTVKDRLQIPADYTFVFTSSATECWEIIAQSLTRTQSQHFFNGAFGQKWAEYAGYLTKVNQIRFDPNEELPTHLLDAKSDVICVTHNETSNATAVDMNLLRVLRANSSGRVIAVDATSSIGGVELDYRAADVWFGSVQKCLGLPAGMGIMLLSPRAVKAAETIGENKHYNSLVKLLENAARNQTSYTPNVLDIYLLYRTQRLSKGIVATQEKLTERYVAYEQLFAKAPGVSFLIENKAVRSKTVLALKADHVLKLHAEAKDRGIVLGNGYGAWKSSTFRIANFPAIKSKEVEKLHEFFTRKL